MKLSCDNNRPGDLVSLLGSRYEWYQTVMNSKLKIDYSGKEFEYRFDESIWKRTLQCQMYAGDSTLLLTKDFLIYRDGTYRLSFEKLSISS